ncbi:uncharacterized protein LOC112495037 [Cephus cinctus]|uniref:Uncharacterized protein LOC112495037 n=1 Tax=Cephus cinctus TaxID=211228 RepID=A0AAJ7W5Q9_CEPCN|nr:uncharacterized protein LOC112495037 [Cephus cinctus]
MCNRQVPWLELLPTVLLGLRTCVKEDLGASCAEMLYGTIIRVPGEFFINIEMPADPEVFVEKFREHMRGLRPTPTAHHNKARTLVLKDLYNSTHVYLRNDAVKPPLEPPFDGPYKIIKKLDDRRFVIDVNGVEKTTSIERLKPAYTKKDDSVPDDEEPMIQSHQWGSFIDPSKKTYGKKVSFPSSTSSALTRSLGGEWMWLFASFLQLSRSAAAAEAAAL